jgi:hypothetical protein
MSTSSKCYALGCWGCRDPGSHPELFLSQICPEYSNQIQLSAKHVPRLPAPHQ